MEMNKYFEKGKELLIKKGYKIFEEDITLVIHFYKRYNENLRQEIWFDTIANEFYWGIGDFAVFIKEQKQIDDIQLAYNELRADLQELKEIKDDNKI